MWVDRPVVVLLLRVQARKPQWETGVKAAISLRGRSNGTAGGKAAVQAVVGGMQQVVAAA